AGIVERRRVGGWWAISLERWPSLRLDRSSLGAIGLFVVLAIFGVSRLGVQDDIRLLQNPPKNLIDDQTKLSRLLDTPTPAQFYIVRGNKAEQGFQSEEMLKQRRAPLLEMQIISGYHALSQRRASAH